VYATSKDQVEMIEEELETAKKLGIPADFLKSVPLPVPNRGAMVFANQARFHPRKYLLALAGMIDDQSNYILENCRALDIKEGEPCIIITNKGELQAKDVVLATHYPFYDGGGMYFARMYQHRSYIVGVRLDEPFPDGMYINAEEGGGSFRSNPTTDGEIVLVSYGGHRTGQADDHIKYYEKLQDFVQEIYKNPKIEYRWSTQDNITLDGVPYIVRITKDSGHVYVGTGFGKWGMSHGTVAGLMISRMILGQTVPWAELYNPTRFKPIASAKELATHMLSSAKEMAAAYLVSNPTGTPEDLSNDSGELMKYDGEQIGAYKGARGKVYKVIPYCKHMGCPLVWNNAERSWDCPCHGSRYNYDGSVIHGPATSDLDLKD
jgi:glycine/D-amino acid oxidase-like deaminating enzyme/nitrite reductase/ring-hydroxylating ferredoxin subunit